MKTNLIFKRQVTIDNVVKTVTRIVSVEVPDINSGEGWVLSGHCDLVEVSDQNLVSLYTACKDASTSIDKADTTSEVKKRIPIDSDKFESPVSGTAKLVRSKGVIKIVARKGKSTFNQTTPNSVCISDVIKNDFFRQCRECCSYSSTSYEFSEKIDIEKYNHWSDFMNTEYLRQKNIFLTSMNK